MSHLDDLTKIVKQIQQSVSESDFGKIVESSDVDLKQQIRESEETTNTFEDFASFEVHIKRMRLLLEDEHNQKKHFRKIATYGALGLVFYSIIFVTILFGFLIGFKNYIPPASVLIAISVTFIANIIGLATIVFKYVFSSTKETTDYISHFDSHD